MRVDQFFIGGSFVFVLGWVCGFGEAGAELPDLFSAFFEFDGLECPSAERLGVERVGVRHLPQ
ncbi:hypothetical protein AXK61_12840 [Tsukamurella pseudospumae]|uniref:Secreted protein n=1 Tax=Tsukamurella pseudospumae TaxID=239498 RepID=A0A137ZRW2_9ACTN|nr:hypothetical protein AXK61_12840 [Tsukamurella pseudospumae]